MLYVSHHSADAELRTEPLVKELLAADHDGPVLCLRPPRRRRIASRHLRQRPVPQSLRQRLLLLGPRASCSTARTSARRPTTCSACSTGCRRSAIATSIWPPRAGVRSPAAFAAVLKNRVKQVTLKQGLTSYAAIAESEDYNWPLSAAAARHPGPLRPARLLPRDRARRKSCGRSTCREQWRSSARRSR